MTDTEEGCHKCTLSEPLEEIEDDGAESIEQVGEPLEALAHRLWTHWSQHIAEEENISEKRLSRWRELWVPYEELSEESKETDRRLVERFTESMPDYEEHYEP